ncbi:hydrogen peroxide-inducible genes activator [Polymorphobacter fuscus]|uniref:LysR family transcriptional regulator n=1 Tax=Sandarakinorhabdus fusca TaxID=1439888 RepID=A0A7C9GQ12_9SPHN|nr:hydrogen peroxide-inducible genes activator [Polymorphobacter fuscus]KAB7648602.1 LysR family transcriptional regulator [Polymorphobacter fuscus]MQT16151.1 LysR family transcriptional regulator [Polymorphobacter fuscus]NJC07570.1 LysR family hydrogen peroxide-inducible transcriptional activator [Polymorphobacter fuscus]
MTFLPTLKQLQYLTALHIHAHFGRAADACFVTQSTLSAGLRELESLLGVQLVERNRRVVRFTPLGEQVVTKAYDVLREADALTGLTKASGEPLVGELRLGVIPTIAPYLLPRVLPRVRAEFPDLKLYLREDMSGPACEALSRGTLDAVLLALPWDCGTVEQMPLFDDPFYLVFHSGDMIDPPPQVAPGAIDDTSLLMLEDGHCLKDQGLAACGRPELRADPAHRGTSLVTLVQMVAGRLGQTLIPGLAIDAGLIAGTGLVARPLAGGAARTVALVWRIASPRAGEFRLLGETLRAAAAR